VPNASDKRILLQNIFIFYYAVIIS